MNRTLFLSLLVLASGCGRGAADADVKSVGVGLNPEEIGPSPTPYGGVVEYNHVNFGGAGLPLVLTGFGGYTEVGPEMVSFEPPYSAVIGFSYIFDQLLPAGDTFSFMIPSPPMADDHCYTQFEANGPIGAFTTVDVGDYMEFRRTTNNNVAMRFDRVPGEYPDDAQDLSIYYAALQSHAPGERSHLVPNPDAPDDALSMVEEAYRFNNFPFGEEVSFNFPGGFSRFNQPVSSIPRPSTSVDPNVMMLPEQLGDVRMTWDGPKYTFDGSSGFVPGESGDQSTCFEFYRKGDSVPEGLEGCATGSNPPSGQFNYDSFKGQMYTGPWETDSGVTFEWDPGENEGNMVLAIRVLAELDITDDSFSYPAVELENGDFRRAQVCEEGSESTSFIFDEDRYLEGDQLLSTLQGDPSSKMAEVTCRLANDGSFTLTEEMLEDALAYGQMRGMGGVVFYLARETEAEATVPAAKDLYDQRHDISPVRLAARSVRIGRFWWGQGGDQ